MVVEGGLITTSILVLQVVVLSSSHSPHHPRSTSIRLARRQQHVYSRFCTKISVWFGCSNVRDH